MLDIYVIYVHNIMFYIYIYNVRYLYSILRYFRYYENTLLNPSSECPCFPISSKPFNT